MEIFLLTIAIIWLIAATIKDVQTTEVPNWLSFSLTTVAIIIYSLLSLENIILIPIAFLILGSLIYYFTNEEKKHGKLKGLSLITILTLIYFLIAWQTNSINSILSYSILTMIIFFVIGNAMYYTKQWGGADTMLLTALGATFPIYPVILKNIFIPKLGTPFFPAIILLNIVIVGSIYGILMMVIKILQNKKKFSKSFKELIKQSKRKRNLILLTSIIMIILGYLILQDTQTKIMIISLAIMITIFYFLLVIVKAAEESSMIKIISTNKLREGDWITKEIKINNKIIYKPNAYGINQKQIDIIKKHIKEIEIKEGMAFIPVFLIAILISLILGNPILWLF